MLPYSTQDIQNADIKAVVRALRSPWLTQGPAIERFERALAKVAGVRYAVALNSGTAALHAAYFAAGIEKGDEIILPPLTFAATGNAALYLGAKPVFADVDPETGNMSVQKARTKITKRTKALVPVDYAGRPADLAAFTKLAHAHGLVCIVDGAQSLGATYQKKPAGSIADMTIYSFHPVKSITTGEGGAIVTNDAEYARRVRLFRTHGITKDAQELRAKHEGAWYMEQHALGFNYRMPDILAALGESQLKRLKTFITKRRRAAAYYDTLLRDMPEVMAPAPDSAVSASAWHLYPLRLTDPKKRRAVFDHLRAAGIGVQVHHIPVYLHPYYRRLGYKKGLCPRAEEWYAREISLPLFPRITSAQQRFVIRELQKALATL